jgi:predicted enzyme related to lactoylglutathione lyase
MMTGLRIELFARDLETTVAFYERVLGFAKVSVQPGGYTVLQNGTVRLDVQHLSDLLDDHPAQPGAGEGIGRGVELVFEVDDIDGYYDQVQARGGAIHAGLTDQPWGLRDFRMLDPDGRYCRFTS